MKREEAFLLVTIAGLAVIAWALFVWALMNG